MGGKATHVVLPADRFHGHGVDVLVEDKGAGDDEVEHVEALGTKVEGQDLQGVSNDQRGEGKTEMDEKPG